MTANTKSISTAEIEEKQLSLEAQICVLSSEKLEELEEHVEIPLSKYSSRLTCSKFIREKISQEIEKQETNTSK